MYLLGVVGGCDNKNYVNYNLEYAKHCNGCVKVFVGNLSYKHVPLNFSEINLKKKRKYIGIFLLFFLRKNTC